MWITPYMKNILFLADFFLSTFLVVSASLQSSFSFILRFFHLLLLSQSSKEAQLFRCCVPLPSSVRGMINSWITIEQ